MGGLDHPYAPRSNRLTDHHCATKSERIRFTNSGERWSLFLAQEGLFHLCLPVKYSKRQDVTTPDKSPKA